MIRHIAALLSTSFLLFTGCAESPETQDEPACTDDTECKSNRVCERGKCVEFEGGASSTVGAGGSGPSSSASTGGSGLGFLPSQCMANVKCVYDSDCPDGHHCNDAAPVPECEALYCGPEGSLCSEDELCQPGLVCNAEMNCMPPPACDCNVLCAQLDDCGFGPPEQCVMYCEQQPEALACGCALSGTPDLCDQFFDCAQP